MTPHRHSSPQQLTIISAFVSPSLEEHSPLVRWSWSPRFVEGGLVLDRFSVMAEVAHYTLARIHSEGNEGGWRQALPQQGAFSGN